MTQGQKTVLALLIGIALLELGFTQRFGSLWQLAFTSGTVELEGQTKTLIQGNTSGESWDHRTTTGGNQNPSPTHGGHSGGLEAV